MNGDGNNDLLVVTPCCGLGVLSNHGDGTFAPLVDYPISPGALSLAYGDFSGDGMGDVAVVGVDLDGNSGPLRVLINASH
jgi:hypothetical protein